MSIRRVVCALLALVALVAVAPAASAAKKPPKPTPLMVSALPVDVTKDIWAWPGSISIDQWPAHTYPPIAIFGREYQGKPEPTLLISMLKVGTPVLAAYAGRVKEIRVQPESCDAEVYIFVSDMTRTASYDHISPTVKPGDVVKVGQQIGTVPAWVCKESFGSFELMVMENKMPGMPARCPLSILTPATAAKVRAQVRSVMESWNAFAGSAPSAYTAEDLTRGVCSTTYVSLKPT